MDTGGSSVEGETAPIKSPGVGLARQAPDVSQLGTMLAAQPAWL